VRLAWPVHGRLYRADQDGKTFTSDDGGKTWSAGNPLQGEPYKFLAVGPRVLYLALSTGAILETTDGMTSWKTVFTP
jgi:photosystem II stability/assembly factor-like uncharacterized protein